MTVTLTENVRKHEGVGGTSVVALRWLPQMGTGSGKSVDHCPK